ncbi:unnamed protein product [Urochloa humidicola]
MPLPSRQPLHLLFSYLLVALARAAISHGSTEEEDAACAAANRTGVALLRPDRLTVLVSGYSERRLRRRLSAGTARRRADLELVVAPAQSGQQLAQLDWAAPLPPDGHLAWRLPWTLDLDIYADKNRTGFLGHEDLYNSPIFVTVAKAKDLHNKSLKGREGQGQRSLTEK